MARRYKPPTRPQIFWDPSQKKYAVKTDHNEAYIQELKTYCNTIPTFSGGAAALWHIDEADLDTILTLVRGHFPEDKYGKLDFIPKPDEGAKRINLNGASAAAKAALTMFEISGYDSAKKVYSLLIRKYHPDVNPDLSEKDLTKAAEITSAWRDLKSHFGWS